MNAYDFDETILKGDSEEYFHKYIFKNYKISLKSKIRFIFYQTIFDMKLIDRLHYKNGIYHYLLELEDIPYIVSKFWEEHKKYIKDWYIKAHKDDDVVISATPRFILEPIMPYIKVKNLIATDFDYINASVNGKPYFDKEKVVQFYKIYPNTVPDNFYSDSFTDGYMAKISKKAWLVKDNKLLDWPIDKMLE